jgi:hypothetical protein
MLWSARHWKKISNFGIRAYSLVLEQQKMNRRPLMRIMIPKRNLLQPPRTPSIPTLTVQMATSRDAIR